MNALEKLRQVVDEIQANTDPLKLQGHWDLAVRLISRFPVDQDAAMEAYKAKDFAAFDALVRSVEAPPKKDDRGIAMRLPLPGDRLDSALDTIAATPPCPLAPCRSEGPELRPTSPAPTPP